MEEKNVKGVIKRLIVLSIVFFSMQCSILARKTKFHMDSILVYKCELIDTSFVNTIIKKTKDNYHYFHKRKLNYIFIAKNGKIIRSSGYKYFDSVRLDLYQDRIKYYSYIYYNDYIIFFINEKSDWTNTIKEENIVCIPIKVSCYDLGIILTLDKNLNEIEAEDFERLVNDGYQKNKRNYRKW